MDKSNMDLVIECLNNNSDMNIRETVHYLFGWFSTESKSFAETYSSAELADLFSAIIESPGAATPRESGE